MEHTKIKVSVDKSHLLTLGEKMYVESIELVRELVNNAYDADATNVYVTLGKENIVIEDDGSGMSEKGLQQFFTIGSEEKKVRNVSPKYGRKRIGQFGIGKFAALAAAEQFKIETKKGKWLYSVIFDKDMWQKDDLWELQIHREPATPLHHEGTKVTLTKLKSRFLTKDVERCLKESVPLRAKKFTVYLNKKPITARFIPGRRFAISINTLYGSIEGEIVVAAHARLVDNSGVECRVKHAMIRREFFGIEQSHAYGLNRLTGGVNADFLPVTASRTDFIRDSAEFKLFFQLLKAEVVKIVKDIKKESDARQIKKATQQLREALSMVRRALAHHPSLVPSGKAIGARRKRAGAVGASTLTEVEKRESGHVNNGGDATDKGIKDPFLDNKNLKQQERIPKKTDIEEKKINIPKPQIIKRIRINKLGVSVGIVPLGQNGPEVQSDGNMIYVNSDHSLYVKLEKKKELLSFHLLRLITQEIILMKRLRMSARQAYEMQSTLLTQAILGETKK